MKLHTQCPGCGINIDIELSPTEAREYVIHQNTPYDYVDRCICDCCKDDGFILDKRILRVDSFETRYEEVHC